MVPYVSVNEDADYVGNDLIKWHTNSSSRVERPQQWFAAAGRVIIGDMPAAAQELCCLTPNRPLT